MNRKLTEFGIAGFLAVACSFAAARSSVPDSGIAKRSGIRRVPVSTFKPRPHRDLGLLLPLGSFGFIWPQGNVVVTPKRPRAHRSASRGRSCSRRRTAPVRHRVVNNQNTANDGWARSAQSPCHPVSEQLSRLRTEARTRATRGTSNRRSPMSMASTKSCTMIAASLTAHYGADHGRWAPAGGPSYLWSGPASQVRSAPAPTGWRSNRRSRDRSLCSRRSRHADGLSQDSRSEFGTSLKLGPDVLRSAPRNRLNREEAEARPCSQ